MRSRLYSAQNGRNVLVFFMRMILSKPVPHDTACFGISQRNVSSHIGLSVETLLVQLPRACHYITAVPPGGLLQSHQTINLRPFTRPRPWVGCVCLLIISYSVASVEFAKCLPGELYHIYWTYSRIGPGQRVVPRVCFRQLSVA